MGLTEWEHFTRRTPYKSPHNISFQESAVAKLRYGLRACEILLHCSEDMSSLGASCDIYSGGFVWVLTNWLDIYIYILAGNYICMQTKGEFAILPTWTSSWSTDVSLMELWFHQWVSEVSNKFRSDGTKVFFKSAELPLIGKGIRTFRDFLRLTTVGFICGFPIRDIISKPLPWRSRTSCNACQGH